MIALSEVREGHNCPDASVDSAVLDSHGEEIEHPALLQAVTFRAPNRAGQDAKR